MADLLASRRSLLTLGAAAASATWGVQALAQGLSPAPPPAASPDPARARRLPSSLYRPPDGVAFQVVDIVSEGVRLHGELFKPTTANGKLPTVLMAHGWGGVAAAFRPDAVDLARAGHLVLTFDYRGWGESDSRVVLTGHEPAGAGDDRFAAEVEAQRGYIDPFEQTTDWFNAIDWLAAEPSADMSRLGLRGSSYSGGHVVYVAARDPRVRAIVSQVPGIADRPDFAAMRPGPHPYIDAAHQAATALAWGRADYPPPYHATAQGLVGLPVGDKLLRWWPNAESSFVRAAALFILAGNDGLVDNRYSGQLAYERVAGPKKLVTIPDAKHFDIYGAHRGEAIKLAIDWFGEHLS